MNFDINITLNDILFLLGMMPLTAIFYVMFKDWLKDKNRNS